MTPTLVTGLAGPFIPATGIDAPQMFFPLYGTPGVQNEYLAPSVEPFFEPPTPWALNSGLFSYGVGCDYLLKSDPLATGEAGFDLKAIQNEIGSIVESFLASRTGEVGAEDRVLFFWDLGKELAQIRRKLYGFDNERFFGFVSSGLMERFSGQNTGLKARGFNTAFYFSAANLADMVRLAHVFPRDYLERIVETINIASGGVWRHLSAIAALDDPFERLYYAEMCYQYRWTLTRLREHIRLKRFQTHTVVRQPDDVFKKAFVQLSKGDASEWIYRDLIRLDFLGLTEDEFLGFKREEDFEAKMLEKLTKIREEFGEGFTFYDNQVIRTYKDVDGNKCIVKMDIVGYVNDGVNNYPIVVELKRVPFDNAVHEQCLKYKHVVKGVDEQGRRMPPGYLKPNEKRVLIMALVPKFNPDFEKVREIGLRGDGRRSSIFVSLYTYHTPPAKFLQKAIGRQMALSLERAVADQDRALFMEFFAPDMVPDTSGVQSVFDRILGKIPLDEAPANPQDPVAFIIPPDKDPKLPF